MHWVTNNSCYFFCCDICFIVVVCNWTSISSKYACQWKDIECSWTERINIVEVCILPKAICKYNAVKITFAFLTEIEQVILKICVGPQELWIAKAVLREKTKATGITISDFKVLYKAVDSNGMALA